MAVAALPLPGGAGPHVARRLGAALKEVEAAGSPEELVARMRALEPELDRLLPAWIRKRRAGYALDQNRLKEVRRR